MATATTETLRTYQLPIGGEWLSAEGDRTFDSVNPYTGEPWAARARGGAADVDRAVRRRARGSRRRHGARDRLRARQAAAPAGDAARARRRAARRARDPRQRQAPARDARPGGGAPRLVLLLRRAAEKIGGDGHPDRQAELPRLHAARAGRRRRRDHARGTPRCCCSAGSSRRRSRRAARSSPSRRSTRRSPRSSSPSSSTRPGFPPGVFNVVTGRGREARRGARPRTGRGQGRVHRLDRRSACRSRARPPGTSRDVTLELGGKSPKIVFADADLDAAANGVIAGIFAAGGPDLRRRLAPAGRSERARRAGRAGRRAGADDRAGRPAGRGDGDGPDGQSRAQLAKVSATSTARADGGRRGRQRRRAPMRALGGLFVEPTVLDRRARRHARRARGGLRPGAVGHHVR